MATNDHPATSLGPRCAIATSTATIRSPSTVRPSRTSLGLREKKSHRTICHFFSKKNESDLTEAIIRALSVLAHYRYL